MDPDRRVSADKKTPIFSTNMDGNDEKKRRTTEAREKVMNNFADDLWIEIFLRLPFKSLLQSKSVSKSWLSIISSHRFAKSYLEKPAVHDDEITIAHNAFSNDYEEEDGSFSLFHLDSASILKNIKFPYSQGEYPCHPLTSELIGSDCGIVCVSVRLLGWHVAKKNFDIYLWNPATRHSKLLPSYTIPDKYWTAGNLGFGFDHIDLDFKLVRVVSTSTYAEVYSSNMNGWRKIDKPIAYPYSNFHAFHGFLFSIEHTFNSMMAFNLNKETFICGIKLPDGHFDDDNSLIDITDFKDNVAVINSIVNQGKIHLWTLDDEACVCSGVEASWTKVISVNVGVVSEHFSFLYSNSHFLLFDKDGERFLFNWNTEVTTEVTTQPYVDEFFKYTKSLFWLEGFRRIRWAASSPRLQDSSDSDE
ncbi:putative F-box protein At1g50870 [Apium graveolens]|uniref:putative F-box protein At1g50870 n=1 Tax=Apium graveolens TaxID=4045 RepID=UPI003D79E046